MKAILINPPSPRTSSFVHLGLAYLGSILVDNKWETKIIDGSAPYGEYSFDSIAEIIQKDTPDFVGITTTTLFSTYASDLIKKVKSKTNEIKILCGGPHATLMPNEMFEAGADIVIRGEGEKTLEEIIPYFQGERSLNAIKGISYRNKNNEIINNPARNLIQDLDMLPLPNKDLFNIHDFVQVTKEKYRFSNIITSRGCPFLCTYCSKAVFGRKFRARSPKSIIDEIKYLNLRYGLNHVDFIDDGFTFDRKRMFIFCKEINNQIPFKLTWSCVTRIDLVDEEVLNIMKDAGCVKINYGIESSKEETLIKINKGISSEEAKKIVKLTNLIGLKCSANFMWGFPWESCEDVKNNRLFMKDLSKYVEDIDPAGILIPFPGTAIYDEYKEKYQFSNWWCDRKKNTGEYRNKIYHPLFRFFGFEDQGMLENDGFFNYSPRIKKEIKKAALFITKHNVENHPFIQRKIALVFITLSRWFYKINPSMEKIISKIFYFLLKLKSGAKTSRSQ